MGPDRLERVQRVVRRQGRDAAIEHLAPEIVGMDPRAYEAVVALLYAIRRQATGGMVQQAIGAIENALDIKAKALGVPVYELFGGPGARAHPPLLVALRHLSSLLVRADADPAAAHARRCRGAGKEVVANGYTALKTNVFCSRTVRACTRPASPAATTSPSSMPSAT